MRAVIERDLVTGVSKVYKSIIDAANKHGVSPKLIWDSINNKRKLKDCMFDYNDGKPSQPKKSIETQKKKDVQLNSSFELRSFEMKLNTICITPCHRKYKGDGSHIYIGSAYCQRCSSFRGIDKVNRTVMCRFKNIYV